MKKTLLLFFLIYTLSALAQSPLPDFMIQKPFYGMNGKIKKVETKTYNKNDVDDIESINDNNYYTARILTFNKTGSVDHILQIYNASSIPKTVISTYYNKNAPIEEWSGVIIDSDTVFKSKADLLYEILNDQYVLQYLMISELETNEVSTLIDTLSIDHKNQAISKSLTNSKQFYKNKNLVRVEYKMTDGTTKVLNYIYKDNLIWKSIFESDDYSLETLSAYTKVDKQDNWIERINFRNGRIYSLTLRKITYWE